MAKTPVTPPSFAPVAHAAARTATLTTTAGSLTVAESAGQLYARLASEAHDQSPAGQEEFVGVTLSSGQSIAVARSSVSQVN